MLLAAGHTDALLLTCMDYRLVDSVGTYMNGRSMKGKYDQVILAGASLGAVTPKFPAWNTTFWEHLDTAVKLHAIHKVIVIDHRDCGAYNLVFNDDFAKDPAKELAIHSKTLHDLRDQIGKKHKDLEVELGLMALDGKVEAIK
jgi:carbonic anhydrase